MERNSLFDGMVVWNIKNKRAYEIRGFVINASDGHAGERMVKYYDYGTSEFYVRETNEFCEKFTDERPSDDQG